MGGKGNGDGASWKVVARHRQRNGGRKSIAKDGSEESAAIWHQKIWHQRSGVSDGINGVKNVVQLAKAAAECAARLYRGISGMAARRNGVTHQRNQKRGDMAHNQYRGEAYLRSAMAHTRR